jgi:hypothetical protein
MLAVRLGLLLVGSGVSVHLEELGETPLQEASTFAERLADAIESRTARRAVLDDPLWPECREASRCVDAIRARTKTDDVVMLRLYSGPTKLRLIAERLSLDGLRNARIEENFPREEKAWADPIANLTERLFPEPPKPEEEITEGAEVPSPTEESVGFFDVAPWAVFGVSAAALAASAGFALSSRAARRDLANQPDEDLYNSTFDRMQSHQRIANGFLVGGLAGIAVGGVLLMFAE